MAIDGKPIILAPLRTDKTVGIDERVDFDQETLTNAQRQAVTVVLNGKSTYQIDSATPGTTVSLTENDIPTPIRDDAPGGNPDKVFLKDTGGMSAAKGYFINLSDGNIYNTINSANGRTDFNINVVKGKANPSPGQIDYQSEIETLQAAVQSGGTSPLQLKIGTGLTRNNTYYPDTNSEENLYSQRQTPENDSNIGVARLQTQLGSYKRLLIDQEVGNDAYTGQTILTQKDFQSLGLQIPLRGSGEIYIPKFGKNQTDDAPGVQILAARAAALVPGAARLGLRVPFNDVTPISTLDNGFNGVLKPDKKLNKPSNFPDLKEEELLSYGSYNTWIAPFDGIERLLQMPALAIQVGAIALIVVAIAEILQGITGKDTYADQVRAGFISFFGLQSSGGNYDSASFSLAVVTAIFSSRMLNETGWYGSVVRGFIKNLFQEISRGAFAVSVTANVNGDTSILNRTGLDIYSDGIDGDVVGAAAKIIELFFNSKLVGFTNMLAQIGEDQVLPRYDTQGAIMQPKRKGLGATPYFGHGLTANQKSFIDSMIDGTETSQMEELGNSLGATSQQNTGPNLSKLIYKNRLNNNQRKGSVGVRPLAWGAGTTPSIHLLPQSIKKAALSAGGEVGLRKLAPYSEVNALEAISPTDIANIENQLNASYMPFYIQDMRTGEILSFHSFVENISDSFSPNYESDFGLGRAEETHTYKNTSREMGLSFYIVSTNPQDHDEMWLKINKLVTLVYPQYTQGRTLQMADGRKFIQPFSQLMGSGPLVRLRLGDLWKSNYSRFNVMRLFGLGKSDFNLDATNSTTTDSGTPGTATNNFTTVNEIPISAGKYNQELERMLKMDLNDGDQIIIYFSKDMDNRVFGRKFGPGLDLDPGAAAARLTGIPPRELYVPDLPPGTYTLQVNNPKNGTVAASTLTLDSNKPIVQYNVNIINPPNGVASDGYVLRYANLEKLNPAEISLFDQLGEAFQSRFSAFENTPTEDLWQRSVGYSSLSTKITVDYNWLQQTYPAQQIPVGNESALQAVNDKINQFFSPLGSGGNPIMQAFENNKGQGIAGFIGSLSFDWNQTWETEWNEQRPNSRAPIWTKVEMRFKPIHDIPVGIDSDGFITSPIYPVGRFANAINEIETVDNSAAEASAAATAGTVSGDGSSTSTP